VKATGKLHADNIFVASRAALPNSSNALYIEIGLKADEQRHGCLRQLESNSVFRNIYHPAPRRFHATVHIQPRNLPDFTLHGITAMLPSQVISPHGLTVEHAYLGVLAMLATTIMRIGQSSKE
jgi:hypothetical protein